MLIKNTAAGLAAGAALALFISASAAQAGGGAFMTAAPSPSVAGETVTLRSTFNPVCVGTNVRFRDITGGADKTLCSGTVDAAGAVICMTNALDDTGSRTIVGGFDAGLCQGAVTFPFPQTVNAVPTAVPTVGEWTMWGLAGLLLIGGGAVASRRFKVARGI